ncbi:MAG: WD40 repeat domain-containing protein [Flammeovirgaceae bacterium]|nr:MAG: WD40 repeat domain-containing protein [Flammeovirgaceae bacterium]
MPVTVKKLHTFTGHRNSVYTLQPSDCDSVFFSAGGDGMVVQWNLERPDDGQLLAQLPNSVYALNFHQPSGLLIAGQNFEGIHLLDWKNKKQVGSLKLSEAYIFDLQTTGNYVFAATGDGTLFVVDLNTLTVREKIKVSDKHVRSLSINEKAHELAAGYSDHSIRIFDLNMLTLKHEVHAHTNSVFTVRYMPGRSYLLSGSRDARLKAWDMKAGYSLAGEVVAHLYAINHLDFSPDLKHFVTCSLDKSIKVWDATEMRLLKVIDKGRHAGHGTSVNRVLWTNHNNCLLSASDDRTISVWDINILDDAR